jgi:hypothetical protein
MSERTDTRLGADTLDALAVRGVDVPGYDRSALVPVSAGFHRAHLVAYRDDLAAGGGDCGISGGGLLDGDR